MRTTHVASPRGVLRTQKLRRYVEDPELANVLPESVRIQPGTIRRWRESPPFFLPSQSIGLLLTSCLYTSRSIGLLMTSCLYTFRSIVLLLTSCLYTSRSIPLLLTSYLYTSRSIGPLLTSFLYTSRSIPLLLTSYLYTSRSIPPLLTSSPCSPLHQVWPRPVPGRHKPQRFTPSSPPHHHLITPSSPPHHHQPLEQVPRRQQYRESDLIASQNLAAVKIMSR